MAGRDSRAIKTSLDLVGDINKTDQKARYFANYDEVSEYLIANMRKSDVVMTMGATNVDSISRTLVK